MKDYYKILEVTPAASQSAIKKSYRRLASLYHPDKSNYEKAKELFQEINEAYQVLGDLTKRRAYDIASRNEEAGATNADTSYNEPTPYSFQRRYKKPLMEQLIERYMKYVRYVCVAFLAFSFLIVFDWYLPGKKQIEEMQYIRNDKSRLSGRLFKEALLNTNRIITNRSNFPVNSADAMYFANAEKIMVYKTQILDIVVGVTTKYQGSNINISSAYNNYLLILPSIVIIFSALSIFYKGTDEFKLNCAIVGLMFVIFTIIVLVQT